MKTWIKRSLIGLGTVAVLAGGLSACGHGGPHGGWSEARMGEMRGKAVERIGKTLELNDGQKQKLNVLADELMAQRQALRQAGGAGAEPREAMKSLIAGDKFDRAKAQGLLDAKLQSVQGQGPKVVTAMADFYDSLTPAQQAKVRERLERGRGGPFGWRH